MEMSKGQVKASAGVGAISAADEFFPQLSLDGLRKLFPGETPESLEVRVPLAREVIDEVETVLAQRPGRWLAQVRQGAVPGGKSISDVEQALGQTLRRVPSEGRAQFVTEAREAVINLLGSAPQQALPLWCALHRFGRSEGAPIMVPEPVAERFIVGLYGTFFKDPQGDSLTRFFREPAILELQLDEVSPAREKLRALTAIERFSSSWGVDKKDLDPPLLLDQVRRNAGSLGAERAAELLIRHLDLALERCDRGEVAAALSMYLNALPLRPPVKNVLFGESMSYKKQTQQLSAIETAGISTIELNLTRETVEFLVKQCLNAGEVKRVAKLIHAHSLAQEPLVAAALTDALARPDLIMVRALRKTFGVEPSDDEFACAKKVLEASFEKLKASERIAEAAEVLVKMTSLDHYHATGLTSEAVASTMNLEPGYSGKVMLFSILDRDGTPAKHIARGFYEYPGERDSFHSDILRDCSRELELRGLERCTLHPAGGAHIRIPAGSDLTAKPIIIEGRSEDYKECDKQLLKTLLAKRYPKTEIIVRP